MKQKKNLMMMKKTSCIKLTAIKEEEAKYKKGKNSTTAIQAAAAAVVDSTSANNLSIVKPLKSTSKAPSSNAHTKIATSPHSSTVLPSVRTRVTTTQLD